VVSQEVYPENDPNPFQWVYCKCQARVSLPSLALAPWNVKTNELGVTCFSRIGAA